MSENHSIIEFKLLGKDLRIDKFVSKLPNSVPEFEAMLKEINELHLYFGGPLIYNYINIHSECAYKNGVHLRHYKCEVIVKAKKPLGCTS